jgi:hypothetical protein
MNNLDKEYILLKSKMCDDEFIAEEIIAIKEGGGIVSVKEDTGNLTYYCADGDYCLVNKWPRLYDSLVLGKEIEDIELTEEEKTNLFSDCPTFDLQRKRVDEYIQKIRNEIAAGVITDPQKS